MSTELPTVEKITEFTKWMRDEGLAAWPNISIHISESGQVHYRMYTVDRFEPFESPTLEGLEEAAREVIANHDPAKELREKAEKLGFELVKKGGAE